MLISADLIPLKKLAQDHPTAWVIDLCQQLQLNSFVHLVNCRLSTAGTLNRQVAELAEIYLHCQRTSETRWQQAQNPFLIPSTRAGPC